MEEIVVCPNGSISFADFLKLLRIYELILDKKIKEFVNSLNLKLKDINIESITYSCLENSATLDFKCHQLENNDTFDNHIELDLEYHKSKYIDEVEKQGYGIVYDRIGSMVQRIEVFKFIRDIINTYKDFSYEVKFRIDKEEYVLNMDMAYNYPHEFFPFNGHFKRIIIKNLAGKTNIFYYDNLIDLWCVKNKDGKFVPIPSNIVHNILSYLPRIDFEYLPDFIKRMIFRDGEVVYQINNREWTKETPNLWDSLMGNFVKGYVLKLAEEKEDKQSISFMDRINGNSNTLVNTNTTEIVNNIKNILIQLKKNNITLNDSQKIKLTDSIFFERIEESRKIVAELFRDHDIIKNCNLEKIDFTNADIEGLDLSNTNARIVLDKLYNSSIRNANLQNVNLIMQELTGIIADGANLCGTNIFVSLDKTSITGTKFGRDAIFSINGIGLDLEMVRSMGILVDIEEQKESELTL